MPARPQRGRAARVSKTFGQALASPRHYHQCTRKGLPGHHRLHLLAAVTHFAPSPSWLLVNAQVNSALDTLVVALKHLFKVFFRTPCWVQRKECPCTRVAATTPFPSPPWRNCTDITSGTRVLWLVCLMHTCVERTYVIAQGLRCCDSSQIDGDGAASIVRGKVYGDHDVSVCLGQGKSQSQKK